VVCRLLGFKYAEKMHLGSYFGQVNGKFSFDMVKCVGNETSIGQCRHWDIADCKPTEVAGVTCAEPTTIFPNQPPGINFINTLLGHFLNESLLSSFSLLRVWL